MNFIEKVTYDTQANALSINLNEDAAKTLMGILSRSNHKHRDQLAAAAKQFAAHANSERPDHDPKAKGGCPLSAWWQEYRSLEARLLDIAVLIDGQQDFALALEIHADDPWGSEYE